MVGIRGSWIPVWILVIENAVGAVAGKNGAQTRRECAALQVLRKQGHSNYNQRAGRKYSAYLRIVVQRRAKSHDLLEPDLGVVKVEVDRRVGRAAPQQEAGRCRRAS